MRSKLLRLTVACACFLAGVCVGAIHRYVRQPRFVTQASHIEQVPAPAPQSTPAYAPEKTSPDYPEKSETGPFDIESFIDQYPHANLERLWQRLKITDDDDPIANFSFSHACGNCKANTFRFNLDNEADYEVVLQIKQPYGESYRYLIFKGAQEGWKLLGHIDVWAKYPPSDPVVLVSHGKAWLIVQSTAGTGSGLGAWMDTLYEVSNRGVKRVVSYLARVNQFGDMGFPTKEFIGRPVSCENKNGHAILKVLYTVEYYGDRISLFTKQKTAVLIASRRDGSYVVGAQSEITPHEYETIYNFDSMGPRDFLNYNRSELRAIATGDNAEKKQWWKEFMSHSFHR